MFVGLISFIRQIAAVVSRRFVLSQLI